MFANEESRDRSNHGLYIFRSYKVIGNDVPEVPEVDRLYNYGRTDDHEIWMVCRATTAAPTFFKRQVIGDSFFSDGAVGSNNPTEEAFHEVNQLHENCLKNVASFGTGKPKEHSELTENMRKKLRLVKPINKLNNLFRTAKSGLTDCERTHRTVEGIARLLKGKEGEFGYYRFNIEEGLGKMKIDECKPTTFPTLKRCAKAELNKPEVREKLRALAQDLVTQRRDRIRDYPDQWERYVCCTRYECDAETCRNDKRKPFTVLYRDEMRAHLQDRHPSETTNPETTHAKLESLRHLPEFPGGPW